MLTFALYFWLAIWTTIGLARLSPQCCASRSLSCPSPGRIQLAHGAAARRPGH